VFQRAIAKARLVDGHNLQVLIQAGHSWLGTTGVAIAFREWRSQRTDRPPWTTVILSISTLATFVSISSLEHV
jgi:hypothetical protein